MKNGLVEMFPRSDRLYGEFLETVDGRWRLCRKSILLAEPYVDYVWYSYVIERVRWT